MFQIVKNNNNNNSKNKTGLRPVLRPVAQPLLGFKTVEERVQKSVQNCTCKKENRKCVKSAQYLCKKSSKSVKKYEYKAFS